VEPVSRSRCDSQPQGRIPSVKALNQPPPVSSGRRPKGKAIAGAQASTRAMKACLCRSGSRQQTTPDHAGNGLAADVSPWQNHPAPRRRQRGGHTEGPGWGRLGLTCRQRLCPAEPSAGSQPQTGTAYSTGCWRKAVREGTREEQVAVPASLPFPKLLQLRWITRLTVCHGCFHGLDPGHDFCQVRKRGGGAGHVLKHSIMF